MAFIDAKMNEVVAYGFEGGPKYSTNEVMLENGTRNADARWMYPQHEYNAQLDNLKDEQRSEVIVMIHACRGKLHNFMFKDWNDFGKDMDPQPLNIPADHVGTKKAVQLYRTYPWGPAYTIRPIQAFETATIYKAGVAVPGTLDKTTGLFTPTNNWAAGSDYTWDGEYYVWVHFADDYNPATINSWQANTIQLDLIEEKRKITATNVPMSWDA